MKLLWIAILALPLIATEPAARLVFIKDFPASTPAYVKIVMKPTGELLYQDQLEEESPLAMKMLANQTEEMFAIAEKLERFKHPLEAPVKVAFMGTKTFRFEMAGPKGVVATEQKFNYSADLEAQKLLDWFEKINRSAQDYYFLERTVRFDRLGVNKALLQLETSHDRDQLVSKETFLPMLDRVVKNSSFLNMARERAQFLADTFRGLTVKKAEGEEEPKPAAAKPEAKP